MSTLNVKLPDDLELRLGREAELTQRPRSEIVRDAIVEHLARVERERATSVPLIASRPAASEGGVAHPPKQRRNPRRKWRG